MHNLNVRDVPLLRKDISRQLFASVFTELILSLLLWPKACMIGITSANLPNVFHSLSSFRSGVITNVPDAEGCQQPRRKGEKRKE